ncbi:coiled-coil domain-containing protein 32 [Sminthopsis crassicaudata]|uniref:coiled-coil domain-containing protein 32 n=1 Tax=Sminthopsis crassicaudata TaxID=9301 RepID=UPI003D695656
MKSFESIDSTVPRSSGDLWAEICSCLPNPDQGDDHKDAFSDSFMDLSSGGENEREAADLTIRPNLKPWAPLQDSEVYLASLEKKLKRIKGLSQEVTSKDMLRTLAQAKKECWDRFLQEKLESEFYMEGLESDESTLEHFKRWLQPDKVAISAEEIQYLIPPESQSEKPGEEPAAVEQ